SVVGIILRVTGQSDYDQAREGCPEARCPTPELAHRGNAARDRMLVGTITAAVGFAGLAGAGLWWAVSVRPSTRDANPSNSWSQGAASTDGWLVLVGGRL